MTAEGTALNGASEAPKAELAAAKVAGERPAEEREGVGGPFVIVNGDSDGLSDRSGSDKADSPRSDEEDLPPTNAGPDADSDHGTAGGELGAPDATVGLPSSNGHAPPPAVESEDGVGERKAEVSDNSEDGPGEQGTAGEELGGEDAPAEVEISHVEAGADSAAPAVYSVANDEELEKETSATPDVAAPEEQQDGTNVAVESSSLDETPTHAEFCSVVLESEGSEEQSKAEHVAAEIMELGTDGLDDSGVNGQHDADMSVDSCVTATEPEIHEDKHQESTITELVEQDGSNGHAHVEPIADSCTSAPEFDNDGGNGQETEALKTKPEVLDESDCGASKGPTEEEVAANGSGCAEDTADTSAELEPAVDDEGKDEIACGVVETEDLIEKDSEGDLHDGDTAVAASSDEEANPPAKEGIDEATPAESEQIMQDDELGKNDVASVILHSEQSEPDQVVELNRDQEVQVEVTAGDGNTSVSDVKSVMVEMNTADSVQTKDLGSTFEDRSVPLHENLTSEVEEVKEQACPEDAHLALNDYSSVQTEKHEQVELPGADVADKSDDAVVEAESSKEVETVDDLVPLHVPAASTAHIEPRSIDLDTELESSDSVQARECSSQEISSPTGDQVISDVSGENGTAVTDDAEIRYKTGDASLEVSTEAAVALGDNEAVVVDEVKPSSATGSESDVVREASGICQTGESRDFTADYQSNNDQPDILDASTTCEELVSPIEDPCLSDVTLEPEAKAPCTAQEKGTSDETCKDVENINACSRSSQEVETKCLEVLEPSAVDGVVPVEHKNDDKHAEKGKEKIGENSSESPIDLAKSHKGDIQEAKVHLDRLTQERDALNVRKKKQKAIFDEHREKLEAARKEENEARAAHVDKRNGLDSARSVIGKLNQANSVEEIDELIARKERTMEHETISLKQEKLFIKEINELKAQRKQVCSNLGSKAEISEAFHQKDHIHEQHKTLKKEADLLFKNLKSLEENRKKIQISFEAERAVLKKLNDELHAANAVRQQAYKNWYELKAEPSKKNMYFKMYVQDRNVVTKYQTSRDMDGLYPYCNNQVENFMKMWNKDDDFRRMYVEANKISTLRRLGTHDGRSLGPDEEPPVIPKSNFNRRPNNPSQLTASSPNVPITTSEAAPEKSAAVKVPVEEDSFPVLPPTQVHKQTKSKTAGTSSQKEKTTAPASQVEDVKHIEKEKARLLAEELELAKKAEELARKEEELRKQKAAADKERLVLEQKAKAKEAEERKKRQAQKAQERAEFKARKEAEMKELRKRKKVIKNGTVIEDPASVDDAVNPAAIATADTENNTSQNARDPEVPQQVVPRWITKLNKIQPMPGPLKKKLKRRTPRQYMFIGVAVALALVALILAVRFVNLPGLSSLGF
ncbi:unnamed protein product [Alopecurus aequalis]